MIEITWLGHATVQFRLESGELVDFPRTEVWPLEIGKPVEW
jgi:hypothetical protein